MYPMRTSCTQVAGTLASDDVVGHNRDRSSAAQLSNESSVAAYD